MDSRADKYATGRGTKAEAVENRNKDKENDARWLSIFNGLLKVGFPTLIAAAAATATVFGPSAVGI